MSVRSASVIRSRRLPVGKWRAPSWWRAALAYVLGNALALGFGFAVAYVALLHGRDITQTTIKTGDFIAYYSGSHLVATGHGASLYDLHALRRLETATLLPERIRGGLLMPYLYTPFLGVVMAPIAALPYVAAYALWFLINCLVLATAMFALERYAGISGRTALVMRLLAMCSLPVILCLVNGQTSILILAMFTLALLAARAERNHAAGVLLACGAIKLPYVLPLLLVFLLRRRWDTLVTFAVTSLCLLAAATVFLGPGIVPAYLRILLAATHWRDQYGYIPQLNMAFGGMTQLILSAPASTILTAALTLLACAALVTCALWARSIDLPFALAVVVTVLASPHVLAHDLTLLFLPAAVALHYRPIGARSLMLLLATLFLIITVRYFVPVVAPLQIALTCLLGLCLVPRVPRLSRQASRRGELRSPDKRQPTVGSSRTAGPRSGDPPPFACDGLPGTGDGGGGALLRGSLPMAQLRPATRRCPMGDMNGTDRTQDGTG